MQVFRSAERRCEQERGFSDSLSAFAVNSPLTFTAKIAKGIRKGR
jgi:hypothetical protein